MESQVPEAQFDNLPNFRDVGKFVNSISTANHIKPGLLYRCARPDETSPADRQKLLHEHLINTILDLRSKTEHINAAKKRTHVPAFAQSALVPIPNDIEAAPLKIPGIKYAEINLNGKGFERSLIWRLRYSSLAKLIFLMAAGRRTEGIAILGKEVMQPRGLIGLGIDTLTDSGPEIKEVFDVFANDSNYPVLVHCTQGKDRTGLAVILVLLLCGVDGEAISADYMKSEPELLPERAERMKEIGSIGLDESFAGCPPDFVEKIVSHLDTVYGGIEPYLDSIGVASESRMKVKHILQME